MAVRYCSLLSFPLTMEIEAWLALIGHVVGDNVSVPTETGSHDVQILAIAITRI